VLFFFVVLFKKGELEKEIGKNIDGGRGGG